MKHLNTVIMNIHFKKKTRNIFRIPLLFLLLVFSVETASAQCASPTSTLVNNTNCTTPNGKITFTAPTPTSDYLFSIDGGITYGAVGQTVFTGLFGGDYPTVSKKISSGCVSSQTIKTLTNPANPAVPTSTVVNNTNCITPNGKITFTAPTPVANYMFSIDNGATFGTAGQTVFAGLSGGSYPTIVKSVASTCVSTFSVKAVASPTVTAPTSTVTNVTNCNTPNGKITFTAPTPVANYQFSVDGGVTFGTAGQTVFSNLTAGTKATVAKLVSTGCVSAKVNKVIANPTVTTPISSVVNVTNCNAPNGKITFTAPTPVASYMFSVDGGATFGTAGQVAFPNLAAGAHATVAKIVSTGCLSAPVSKAIANPTVTAPTATPTNVTNCNTPNGRITFTAPTPVASYAFSVDGGVTYGTTGQTVFNSLNAGVKPTVVKLVSSGCRSAAVNVTVANPTVTAPTAAVTPSNCATATGVITFSAPTPLANYVFSVDNGANFGATNQTTFNGLAAGTYVTRSKLVSSGCVSAAVNKAVVNSTVVAPTSTVTALTSCDAPNGVITFTAPTPTANYQYSVDGGATFGTQGQTVFNGLDVGTYATVAKLVSSGCVSPAANKSIVKPAVTAPVSTPTAVTNCTTPDGAINFTGPTPTANYVFSVDGGTTFGTTGQTSFPNLAHGVYPTVSKLVSSGCTSAVVNKTVSAPVVAGADQAICLNQVAIMTATAATGASWTAQPGNPSATTIATPTNAKTRISGFTATGIYNFIWATSTCSDTVSVEVDDCSSPLACTNFGYLFQSVSGSGTDFISVNLQTGVSTTLYNDITTAPVGINAIGYNITDGHIWGSVVGGPIDSIARVGANGIPVYFSVPGLVDAGYNVGAVDDNGILYLYSTNTTDIYRVDVNPASPTYLTLLSPVLNTTAMAIADWAYNSVDGFLYAVNTNAAAPIHQLLKVNPNTGVVTIVGTVTSSNAAFNNGSFGAAYLDASGNLYVSDNTAGGIYKLPVVNNITGNTTAVLFSQGAVSSGNDGAFCTYACLKPDAGRDTSVCMNGIATMSATSVSGVQWLADAANPGTAVIADSFNAQTTISGFSAPGTYNFIWNSGGLCGDTASIIVYSCVLDTVVTKPPSATCSVTVCGTPGSIAPSDTTIYTTCGVTGAAATEGSLTIDESGCAVWTPNGTQVDTVNTCIVTCNGAICDTTFILILPPGNITDTIITVMPSCPTCAVTGICPIVDDIPVDETTTYSTCGLSTAEAAQGTFALDAGGCGTWTPNGSQTDSITTCIVACTIACDTTVVCDTTFIIIPPLNLGSLASDLLSFTAQANNCSTTLNWETTHEVNSKSFIVERNTGAKWSAITTVPASGSSNVRKSYTFMDASGAQGKALYRLRMVDVSGLSKYSNTITVYSKCDVAPIAVYPNPGTVNEGFRITSPGADEVHYRVFDASGHVVRFGSFTTATEIKGLQAGVYLVRANNAVANISQTIIIH